MSKQMLELADELRKYINSDSWQDFRAACMRNAESIIAALQSSADSAPACVHKSCDDPEWCAGEPACRYTEPQTARSSRESERFERTGLHVEEARTLDESESRFPLQYEDGPDFCTVKDAQGRDFALTVQPEMMKAMERALVEDVARLMRPPQCQAVSAQHRYDQDGQTCPTCGRVGNGEG